MEQRTCNVIMCCKGHCRLPGSDRTPRGAIAAYMANECACPIGSYLEVPPGGRVKENRIMESVLREALFDYFKSADNPSADLRQLLQDYVTREPTLCERIIAMFQLCEVMKDGRPVNGFSQALLEQADKDLADSVFAKAGDPEAIPPDTGLFAELDRDEERICDALDAVEMAADGMHDCASVFLHGHCGPFAIALHDETGCEIWLCPEESPDGEEPYGEPVESLAHMFGAWPDYVKERLALMDVRGMSFDQEAFLSEFDDFLDSRKPKFYSIGRDEAYAHFRKLMGPKALDGLIAMSREYVKANIAWYRDPSRPCYDG